MFTVKSIYASVKNCDLYTLYTSVRYSGSITSPIYWVVCSLDWIASPSDMISHSACRVLSSYVSMGMSTIRVGLAFICMCTSCTDRSRPRIGPVLHEFILERASACLTALPGRYLMLTSCYCMRSGIRANLGGAAKR